jgi:hypothetical protein
VLVDEVGDAAGEDAGLAGSGARQHQERPLEMLRGLALLRVQTVEQ